jgi:hypothetical protein
MLSMPAAFQASKPVFSSLAGSGALDSGLKHGVND